MRFEREVDVLRLQYLIGLLQERQYTAETEICNRLVDDFLDLDGTDADSNATGTISSKSSRPWHPINAARMAMERVASSRSG